MLSRDDARVVAADRAVPGLALALDETALAEWASRGWADLDVRSVTVTYVRYKPGTNCLAGGGLVTRAGVLPFTVKAYPYDELAPLDKARRWTEAKPGRLPALVDGSRALVMTAFPHDAKIRALGRFTPTRLPRLLRQLGLACPSSPACSMHILSYRPERRLVARVRGPFGTAVVRAYSEPEFAQRVARVHRLQRHPVPHAGAREQRHPDLPMTAAAWLEGVSLDRQLTTVARDTVVATGRALADLHQAPADGLPVMTTAEERTRVLTYGEAVAALVPEAASRARALAERVAQALPTTSRLSLNHGDFAARQVVLSPAGPRFIDLDELVAADARLDLGAWLADLDYLVLRGDLSHDRASWLADGFLEGYHSAAAPPAGVGVARAAALFALAPLPFRRRSTSWRTLTKSIVGAVERRLDRHRPERCRPRARRRTPVAGAPQQGRGHASRSADDPGLPWLPRALDLDAARAALAASPAVAPDSALVSAVLVRHKLARRAVIRYELRSGTAAFALVGKMHHRGVDRRSASVQQSLREAGFDEGHASGIATPEVCGTAPDLGLWLQRGVDGVSASSLLSAPGARQVAERLADVTRALAARGPRVGRTHTTAAELLTLERRLGTLAARRPRLAGRLTRMLEACRTLAGRLHAGPLVPAHRDFYSDQVLITGSHAYVVDLDLYCLAPPALDAGNCLAHLIELGLRDGSVHPDCAPAFMARAEAGLRDEARRSLNAWTTLALARLIEIADRLPGRAHAVNPLVELVEGRLATAVGQPSLPSRLVGCPAPSLEVRA
ncbi:MAG: aminoglycoside phosphotransferase family protein [Acidobacteriota bacterium]|nr:aminoglycoside phosphotransferase family protein [Acidobacteriota bacterium]